MKTDEQYDSLLTELRKEIGASRKLMDEAVELIPLVDPEIMRHYADKYVKMGATKDVSESGGNTNAGNDSTDSKTALAKAIDKRLDTILNHYYKGPAPRTT